MTTITENLLDIPTQTENGDWTVQLRLSQDNAHDFDCFLERENITREGHSFAFARRSKDFTVTGTVAQVRLAILAAHDFDIERTFRLENGKAGTEQLALLRRIEGLRVDDPKRKRHFTGRYVILRGPAYIIDAVTGHSIGGADVL